MSRTVVSTAVGGRISGQWAQPQLGKQKEAVKTAVNWIQEPTEYEEGVEWYSEQGQWWWRRVGKGARWYLWNGQKRHLCQTDEKTHHLAGPPTAKLCLEEEYWEEE